MAGWQAGAMGSHDAAQLQVTASDCPVPPPSCAAAAKRVLPPDTNDRGAVLAACRSMVQQLRAAMERWQGSGGQPGDNAAAAKRARVASDGTAAAAMES